jgi:hypothetical protein
MTETDEGQNLAVPVPRCWAYNKTRQRCDMPAGHLGDHAISVSWSDEDSFDPMDVPVPFIPTSGGSIVPTTAFTANRHQRVAVLRSVDEEGEFFDTEIEEDADLLGETGKCFSCGCPEDEHPCEQHGCRNYIP